MCDSAFLYMDADYIDVALSEISLCPEAEVSRRSLVAHLGHVSATPGLTSTTRRRYRKQVSRALTAIALLESHVSNLRHLLRRYTAEAMTELMARRQQELSGGRPTCIICGENTHCFTHEAVSVNNGRLHDQLRLRSPDGRAYFICPLCVLKQSL